MSNSVQDLINNLANFEFNPVAIQTAALQTVVDSMGGEIDLVDPTNPLVQVIQVGACMTAAAMQKSESNNRKQYPSSAQTYEDIFPHMSDTDFVGRFASPATARFGLVFLKEELLLKMIPDPDTGISKIVIPRNTYFTIGGVDFSLQYPIEIRQMQHGGINVIYDTTIASPLEELPTNVVEWSPTTDPSNRPCIMLHVDTQQFNIVTQTSAVNKVKEYSTTIELTDQFYYARVYSQNNDGTWQEIKTTHTDLTFDITQPTALLQVTDHTVKVTIPYVYLSSELVKNQIRIDLYETKGPLVMQLANYPSTDFAVTWYATDKVRDINGFTAPLETLSQIYIFSNTAVNSGRNQLDFLTLREQVINNTTGSRQLPITPDQINTALSMEGYDLVKNVDNVTNRVFIATKAMPTPTNNRLITAASASIETVNVAMNSIVTHPGVIDNGNSITLTPSIVYEMDNGVVNIVPQSDIDAMLAASVDQQALIVTSRQFLTTPFHYVLDASGSTFALRAYYLSNPLAPTKYFVSENDTTLFQVATDSYNMVTTPSGFKLRVATVSGDSWKALPDDQVYAQLAFTPAGEISRAYIMGTLVGKSDSGERVYDFDLSSNMNVDSQHRLQLTKFMMFNPDPRIVSADLLTEFDIVYSTSHPVTEVWQRNEVDDYVGLFLLPSNTVGVSHEKIRIEFGKVLDTLWSRSRSMVSSIVYRRYSADVPATYSTDVYEVFPDGSTVKIVNGNVTYNVIHRAGDPVLDANNQPVLLHRAGDVMLDAVTGLPIPVDERAMLRQIDLMMIEGAYYFATDSVSLGYNHELINTVIDWITNDLEELQQMALEQTHIYFYPKVNMGMIDVMIDDGAITTIEAGQSFGVTLYVSKAVDENEGLKANLVTATIRTINQQLNNVHLSVSEMITALTKVYGTDVIGMSMSGFGPDNLQMMTLKDPSQRCSLKKQLVAQADGTLIVKEAVTVMFVQHQLNS